jgi:hypothetical protein
MRSCPTPAVYNQALSIPVKWHEVFIAVNHGINPKSDSPNADGFFGQFGTRKGTGTTKSPTAMITSKLQSKVD